MSVETICVQDLFSYTRWIRNNVRAMTSWPETRSRSSVPKKSRRFFVPDVSSQRWVSSHHRLIRRCQLHNSMCVPSPQKDCPKFDPVELVSACSADTDTATQAHYVRPYTLDFFGEVWSWAGPNTWTPPRGDKGCCGEIEASCAATPEVVEASCAPSTISDVPSSGSLPLLWCSLPTATNNSIKCPCSPNGEVARISCGVWWCCVG